MSQSAISRIERGDAGQVLLDRLGSIARVLGARLDLDLRWRGEELDRLLDARHAELCGRITGVLREANWTAAVEVTFSEWGERGSIDVLAFHPASGSLVVFEAKTALASAEELLRRLDVKVRLGGRVAADRFGWSVATISAIVVFDDSMTARRRVARAPIVGVSLPLRGVAVRRWLRSPTGTVRGVWFASSSRATGGRRIPLGRHRIRRAQRPDPGAE